MCNAFENNGLNISLEKIMGFSLLGNISVTSLVLVAAFYPAEEQRVDPFTN